VFRLVPGAARAGFVLSPLVSDGYSFCLLQARGGLRDLVDRNVPSIRVLAASPSGSTLAYHRKARLRLWRLRLEPRDLEDAAGVRELRSLQRLARQGSFLRSERPPRLALLPDGTAILDVSLTSAIVVTAASLQAASAETAARFTDSPRLRCPAALRLGFGIATGDGRTLPPATAAGFRLSWVDEDGSTRPIWSTRLQTSPAGSRRPGDAGVERRQGNEDTGTLRRSETVALTGPPAARLLLETFPDRAGGEAPDPAGEGRIFAFWSELRSE
jgi:hypothetical protein